MSADKNILTFGFYSCLSLVLLTIVTWAFGMIAVPPAGPYCPGDCMSYPFPDILSYYPRDYYWMYLSIFQLFAYSRVRAKERLFGDLWSPARLLAHKYAAEHVAKPVSLREKNNAFRQCECAYVGCIRSRNGSCVHHEH